MKKPKNQHAAVLWYLITEPIFTMKTVINDSMFFKFQSRLSEIEQKHGTIANRERVKFRNKFGNKGSCNMYSAIDVDQLKQLYKEYNK
jgi:hypothetical protein